MIDRVIAGRYRLDAEVGRGGMGAVWRGTDTVLGRTVALKRVGVAPGGATPDAVRAEREARLAAQLNHPHVVAVFDLVTEEGGQYSEQYPDRWLVMEYVEGTNLSELIRSRGALTPDEVAPLLAQAASALAAAHGAGIVHRDVKPSNILVTADGQVKLSDFGIARTQADAALTQTGLVTGSPAYLAPEVAAGQQATPASDVWSLGATLYHALEGRPPYDIGDNLIGGMYRIVHEEPPRPARPGWLAPLPAATMTREPAARWAAEAVQRFLEAGPLAAPATVAAPAPVATTTQLLRPAEPAPARRPWGLLALVAVVVVAVLTVAGFAIGLYDRGGNPRAGDSTQSGSGASSSSTSSSASAPTAAAMRQFLSTYLATVTKDPQAAWSMLTPAYQEQSKGYDGYVSFWGTVTNPRLVSAQADPSDLVIDYVYSYEQRGHGSRQESHRMQLSFQDGHYLIAGQT